MSGLEGFAPSFKAGDEPSYTKYTESYYDMLAEANIAYNSMRTHDETLTGKELVKKELEFEQDLEVRRILKPYQKEIRNLNKDLKNLRFRRMSRKQKLHEREKLLRARNKEFMDAVKEAKAYLKGK